MGDTMEMNRLSSQSHGGNLQEVQHARGRGLKAMHRLLDPPVQVRGPPGCAPASQLRGDGSIKSCFPLHIQERMGTFVAQRDSTRHREELGDVPVPTEKNPHRLRSQQGASFVAELRRFSEASEDSKPPATAGRRKQARRKSPEAVGKEGSPRRPDSKQKLPLGAGRKLLRHLNPASKSYQSMVKLMPSLDTVENQALQTGHTLHGLKGFLKTKLVARRQEYAASTPGMDASEDIVKRNSDPGALQHSTPRQHRERAAHHSQLAAERSRRGLAVYEERQHRRTASYEHTQAGLAQYDSRRSNQLVHRRTVAHLSAHFADRKALVSPSLTAMEGRDQTHRGRKARIASARTAFLTDLVPATPPSKGRGHPQVPQTARF